MDFDIFLVCGIVGWSVGVDVEVDDWSFVGFGQIDIGFCDCIDVVMQYVDVYFVVVDFFQCLNDGFG